jgi:hypothetical protein
MLSGTSNIAVNMGRLADPRNNAQASAQELTWAEQSGSLYCDHKLFQCLNGTGSQPNHSSNETSLFFLKFA